MNTTVLLLAKEKAATYVSTSIATDILVPWSVLLGYTIALCLMKSFIPRFQVPSDLPFSTALTLVTGFLLVFRTNGAYDRFWEGRKYWATIRNISRNLSRLILVGVKGDSQSDVDEQSRAINQILEFCHGVLNRLREMQNTSKMQSSRGLWKRMTGKGSQPPIDSINVHVASSSIEPIACLYEIGAFIQRKRVTGKIDAPQASAMDLQLASLSECLSGKSSTSLFNYLCV